MLSGKKPLRRQRKTVVKAFLDTSAILRLLIKDDAGKCEAVKKLIQTSRQKGIALHILSITTLEIVWVLEKVYKLNKVAIAEIAEAMMNTPQLKIELESAFRKAIRAYAEKNVKFADAVMAYWGIEENLTTVFTFDEKHFKRIDGLTVKKPV
jgi:predicted nucleic-acid-binding protein